MSNLSKLLFQISEFEAQRGPLNREAQDVLDFVEEAAKEIERGAADMQDLPCDDGLPDQWTADLHGFVLEMKNKLRQNTHKGHWARLPISYLLARLGEEVTELSIALRDDLPIDAPSGAADVANFAMMIAANIERDIAKEPRQ